MLQHSKQEYIYFMHFLQVNLQLHLNSNIFSTSQTLSVSALKKGKHLFHAFFICEFSVAFKFNFFPHFMSQHSKQEYIYFIHFSQVNLQLLLNSNIFSTSQDTLGKHIFHNFPHLRHFVSQHSKQENIYLNYSCM